MTAPHKHKRTAVSASHTQRYLIDTNIISYFVRGEQPKLNRKMLAAMTKNACAISVISFAELQYGMALKPTATERNKRIQLVLAQLPILPWDEDTAIEYGELKASLHNQGRPIGELDTQIAAHALAHHFVLVTHNTKHFEEIEGLKLEDWAV